MNFTKESVCVFIKDEVQLKEAKDLLKKYGYNIDSKYLYMSKTHTMNFLQKDMLFDWSLFDNNDENLTEITLSELETILFTEIK